MESLNQSLTQKLALQRLHINMPYTYKKEGDKYCVYKKDGGKKVGCTKGNKEALRKYMAALHMHEINNTMKTNKPIKLANLLESENPTASMSTEQKKAFLEAVYRFAENANSIYRTHSLKETSKYLGELIEAANHLTLSETESRHLKHLDEAYKIFEKTANEMATLQQRLESAYEDIGSTLNKYYDVGGMVTEAQGEEYQKFFQKAMKKFKIEEPGDLETPRQKKKFFNYVDKNYVAKEEPGKDKGAKETAKEK
jgi:hypothetical protein